MGVAVTTALLPRGSRFGDIKLTGYLGSGGFSDVYAGQDSSGRRLAVKVLRLTGLNAAQQTQRVRREQEALARVDSRGVAKLISADLTADQPWIASEFVDGPTLKESIETQGPLTFDETLGLIRRLAEIVAELHELGIAHRDITPNNIIFGPDGPVLIDFGSARIDLENEATGSILLAGTPGFTPPEAEAGLAVGKKADVYALGQLAIYCLGNTELPETLTQAKATDPEVRPTAHELAASLTPHNTTPARNTTRNIRQLPRRFSVRTVGAVAVAFTIATASILYFGFIREPPVRTLYDDEPLSFALGDYDGMRSIEVGSPYFEDIRLPKGWNVEREVLELAAGSDPLNPFLSAQTLDALRVRSDDNFLSSLFVTVELPAKSLTGLVDVLPREEQVEAAALAPLLLQYLHDIQATDATAKACSVRRPQFGSYIEFLDSFVLGSLETCGAVAQVSMLALNRSTGTLYRIHGLTEGLSRQDVLAIFSSVIPNQFTASPSVIPLHAALDLAGAQALPNIFENLGHEQHLLITAGSPPGSATGRVAIHLEPGESFMPLHQGSFLRAWAVLSGENVGSSFGNAVTLGNFHMYDERTIPVIENYFEHPITVVLELSWDDGLVPQMDLLPMRYEDPGTPPYISRMFSYFDRVTSDPYETFGPYTRPGQDNSYVVDWEENQARYEPPEDILLATSTRSIRSNLTSDLFEYRTLGEVKLPLPSDLTIRTTGYEDSNFALRANSAGLNSQEFSADQVREVLIRNSQAILPGSTEIGGSGFLPAPLQCRTFRRGFKSLMDMTLVMTLKANCVENWLPSSPSAYDRFESPHPHVTIELVENSRLGQFKADGASAELLRIDMTMGYTEDVSYIELLLRDLDEGLAGLKAEDARIAFGQPAFGK